METLLLYVVAALVILPKLGIKLPLLDGPLSFPSPLTPHPANPVDTPAEFLAWILKIKSGTVRLTDSEKETVKLIKASMSDLEIK